MHRVYSNSPKEETLYDSKCGITVRTSYDKYYSRYAGGPLTIFAVNFGMTPESNQKVFSLVMQIILHSTNFQ